LPELWKTDAPKVLVVADDRDAGELLARLVDAAGWSADLAFSSEAALAELTDAVPAYSAVVVDLAADGGEGGLDALHRIREVAGPAGAVPVVMCSWSDGIRAQAWVSGIDGFLTRPFHGDELVAQLRDAIERPAAQRDGHRQQQIGLSIPDAPD
jgi:DNA-binding response OmpR family regulator